MHHFKCVRQRCRVAVSFMCHFPAVPWVDLWSVIVVFFIGLQTLNSHLTFHGIIGGLCYAADNIVIVRWSHYISMLNKNIVAQISMNIFCMARRVLLLCVAIISPLIVSVTQDQGGVSYVIIMVNTIGVAFNL